MKNNTQNFIFNSASCLTVFFVAFLLSQTLVKISLYDKTNQILQKSVAVKSDPTKSNDKKYVSGFSETKVDNNCSKTCRVCKCDDFLSKNKVIEQIDHRNSKPLQITYKPRPNYTQKAKNNNIQGHVRIRVTFLPNGAIGSVSEVAGLPFGLSEKSIEAAKKIKFIPQTVNGKPVAVTKVVAYTFTIY